MSLARSNFNFKDPHFFYSFPGVLHPSLAHKHVNYLGGGVCVGKYVYFSRNILKSHTILFLVLTCIWN